MTALRGRATAIAGLLCLVALGGAAPADGAGAPAPDEAPVPPLYTIQGRGYAAVLGYPADEVPSAGGDEEEPPPESPPAQTCPENGQGIDEATRQRLDALVAAERPTAEPDPEVSSPTPQGQPIKFDLGLADVSLRSDPGSHAVASAFYVDLGGGQDPWTTAEADGYASGHARQEERCARLYAGEPGTAEDAHVLAVAPAPVDDGPSALAYTRMDRTTLPGAGTFDASITRVVMDSSDTDATASVVTIVEGIELFGAVRADSVVTVLTYVTDGTDAGTVVTVDTAVEGLVVDGQPVAVTAGAPAIAADGLAVGLAAPQIRELEDGTLEVEAGGFYVGTEQDNPVGLQSKQAISLGGARLRAAASPGLPAFVAMPREASAPGKPVATGAPDAATPASPFASQPPTGFTPAPVAGPAGPGPASGTDAPAVAAPAVPAPAPLGTVERLGVYRTPPQVVGVVGLAVGTLLAALFAASLWARHRSWRIQILLGAAGLRWLDRSYRAFLRG